MFIQRTLVSERGSTPSARMSYAAFASDLGLCSPPREDMELEVPGTHFTETFQYVRFSQARDAWVFRGQRPEGAVELVIFND